MRSNIGFEINNSGEIARVGSRYLTPSLLSNVGVAFNSRGVFGDVLQDLPGRPAFVSADYSAAHGVNDHSRRSWLGCGGEDPF